MLKTNLKGITSFYPFDSDYIKVAKAKETKWNLMDKNGNLISDNWFSSISKNNDGTIATTFIESIARKCHVATATFLNATAIGSSVAFKKIVPLSLISFLDVESVVVLEKSSKYVAKATYYGYTIYIDSKGNTYDLDGNEVSIKISTVEIERLHKAVCRFNKKMHYDCVFRDSANSVQKLYNDNVSAWCFYFITDKLSFSIGYQNNIKVDDDSKKWTNGIIFSIIPELIPESVYSIFIEKLGEPFRKNECNGLKWHFWNIVDYGIDRFINLLDSI